MRLLLRKRHEAKACGARRRHDASFGGRVRRLRGLHRTRRTVLDWPGGGLSTGPGGGLSTGPGGGFSTGPRGGLSTAQGEAYPRGRVEGSPRDLEVACQLAQGPAVFLNEGIGSISEDYGALPLQLRYTPYVLSQNHTS